MTGADFYNLALALQAKGGPAELRSATSRAYYAAFHRAHELLSSIGIRLPQGPSAIRSCAGFWSNPGIRTLHEPVPSSIRCAKRGTTPITTLPPPIEEGSKTVAVNLATAKEIMDCIDLCFAGRPKAGIHANMKRYAQETLKLAVS